MAAPAALLRVRWMIVRNTAYCSTNAATFAPIAPTEMNHTQIAKGA
jgi:hypothetical protein